MDHRLIASLVTFFKIETLLTCENNRDSIINADALHHQSDNLFVSHLVVSPKEVPDKILRHNMTLVACESIEFQDLQRRPQLFDENIVWLFSNEGMRNESIGDLPLSLKSNFLVATEVKDTYELNEHYIIKSNVYKQSYFGEWTVGRGLQVEKYIWERRTDLSGVELTVTTLDWEPLIFNISQRTAKGWLWDVLTYLEDELNFSIILTQPEDGNWGARYQTDNGSVEWNGMVGQLQKREVDICGATLTITLDRSEVIDFSVGLMEDVGSIYMVNPALTGHSARAINLMVFLAVFTKLAWTVILVTGVSFAICYMCHSKIYTTNSTASNLITGFFTGLSRFFLDLLQKGYQQSEVDKQLHRKVLTLASGLTAYLLFSLYTGDLTASMTAGSAVTYLRSWQDVLDKDLNIATEKGAVYYDLMKHAKPDSILHKVFHSGKFEPMPADHFLENKLLNYVLFSSEYTNMSPDFLFYKHFDDAIKSQLAFAFQKDSEFKPLFDYKITKMRQAGLLKRLDLKWLEGHKPDDISHRIFQEDPINLGYENLFFPILVMLGGIALGISFLIAEILHVWNQKKEEIHITMHHAPKMYQ